jgi:hypothetical protein
MWTLVLGIFVLVALVLASRRRLQTFAPAPLPTVTTEDIPAVLAALSSDGEDGDFAVFLFGESGQPPATMDELNVQFSIESERMGIDWVLLAPLNLENQARFVAFLERNGRSVQKRQLNDVRSLRVEGDGLAELLQQLLLTEFGVRADQVLQLVASGFEWGCRVRSSVRYRMHAAGRPVGSDDATPFR